MKFRSRSWKYFPSCLIWHPGVRLLVEPLTPLMLIKAHMGDATNVESKLLCGWSICWKACGFWLFHLLRLSWWFLLFSTAMKGQKIAKNSMWDILSLCLLFPNLWEEVTGSCAVTLVSTGFTCCSTGFPFFGANVSVNGIWLWTLCVYKIHSPSL